VNILFHAPKLLSGTNTAEAERFIMVGPDGTWGNITVVDGRGLWRLTVIGSEQKLDLDNFDPAAYIRRAIGADDVDFEVRSISPWRRTQLVANRYSHSNVLLAGDSVHTMSPTGGFGVNTGIGDAVDLGWKLDAALAGWGGRYLLDSYEAERRPIGVRNATASTQNFRGWSLPDNASLLLEDSPRGAVQRAEAGRRLLAATYAEWESVGVILGYRYENSPICVQDGTLPTPDEFSAYVPVARPGSRAPHCWLPDGRSTLDLFGRGFVVVHSADARGDAMLVAEQGRQRGVPISTAEVPGDIVRAYEAPLVLVRPDGHVGWRASAFPDDVTDVIETVRGAREP
jgi:hypothetical protein